MKKKDIVIPSQSRDTIPLRWRMLEGKDPETLELIQKINNLQKRLITKQEEIIEKDLKMEEVDRVKTTNNFYAAKIDQTFYYFFLPRSYRL
jgi:hypothetical protein